MVLFNIWRALQHVHLTNINSHEEKNVFYEKKVYDNYPKAFLKIKTKLTMIIRALLASILGNIYNRK